MVIRSVFQLSLNHALGASDLGLAIGHYRADRYICHSDRNGHRIGAHNNHRGDRSKQPVAEIANVASKLIAMVLIATFVINPPTAVYLTE
jgi:hypothetical protein